MNWRIGELANWRIGELANWRIGARGVFFAVKAVIPYIKIIFIYYGESVNRVVGYILRY